MDERLQLSSRAEVQPLVLPGSQDAAVLFIHGFTGSPAVWRPIAAQVHEAVGATAAVPLLPGHGTSPEDMAETRWEDWTAACADAYHSLTSEHSTVIVCGLSMGGALALSLAQQTGLDSDVVLVNPALFVDSPAARFASVLRYAIPAVPGIANDIAMPGQDESAYARTPVASVAELHRGVQMVRSQLWKVKAPVRLLVSATDHVVGPRSNRFLRTRLVVPPRVTVLRSSYHVATLDYDAPVIAQTIIDSVRSSLAEAG